MSVASDPLLQRESVRDLVPTIEAIATGYANQCEPVRAELNRLLALPEIEWLDGLYSAGSVLAPLELWEHEPPPDVRASPKTHARYAIRQLFSAATACDDQLFRARFQRLQRDHIVANAAIAERTEAVDSLFLCCLKHAHDATVYQFRAALATVGLEPTLSLKDDFRRCGGEFSPVAHAAISHWLDRSGPHFCRVGNRVLMIGEAYAPPSVQPPEEGPAPTPDDEPIPAPEADDIQAQLRAAIAELRANENGTDEHGGGGKSPPVAERGGAQAATPALADSDSDDDSHEERSAPESGQQNDSQNEATCTVDNIINKQHNAPPSQDKQDEIVAAIRRARCPLQRPDLVRELRLKSEGKLGHHLAWMVGKGILINIRNRGYWPAGDKNPE